MTTADTSARRSARRSGSTEPVIEGPELMLLLRRVIRSPAEICRGVAAASLAASLPGPLLHPASASSERPSRVTRLIFLAFMVRDTTTSFGNSTYDVRTALRVAHRTI